MNTCNECGKDNVNNLKYCRWCGYELPKVNVEEKVESVSEPQKKTDYKKIIVNSVEYEGCVKKIGGVSNRLMRHCKMLCFNVAKLKICRFETPPKN